MTTRLELLRTLVAPAVGVLALGCLGPNPLLDAGDDASDDPTEVGEGDGDGDGDGDAGDGDGDAGDGDGDTGDGDGEPETCSNGVLDEDETDVDCGGSCGACDDGSICATETDCASQVCADLVCQAPTCEDQIQNGNEAGVDCGGSACGFCQFSQFWPELDDFQGTAATFPEVAMFADHSFAITYTSPTQGRVRWFDEYGVATGPSIELSDSVSFSGYSIPLVAGVGDDHPIHALETGADATTTTTDLFLIRRTPAAELSKIRILSNVATNGGNNAGMVVTGSKATVSWRSVALSQIFTQRLDYDAGGAWTDITPFQAETQPNEFNGREPAIARNSSGTTVVAWIRCEKPGDWPCGIAVRRFDGGWVDPAPVITNNLSDCCQSTALRVAIAEDGRVAVAWTLVLAGSAGFAGWILDADLVPEGPSWTIEAGQYTSGDVAALDDGSFAFVWPVLNQHRIHLRRYLSAETPKLPDILEESPWAAVQSPTDASIANVDGRAVVVWSGVVDGVAQVQGQVLAY